jgi:hypothetical protein
MCRGGTSVFAGQNLRQFLRLNTDSHDSGNIGTDVRAHVGRPTHAAVEKIDHGRGGNVAASRLAVQCDVFHLGAFGQERCKDRDHLFLYHVLLGVGRDGVVHRDRAQAGCAAHGA